MRDTAYSVPTVERKTLANGFVFGAPVRDLGFFASLIMGVATGMAAFFGATFLGIVGVMVANSSGHPTDYALSYRRVGFPVGVVVMALALLYLFTFWTKRILRRS